MEPVSDLYLINLNKLFHAKGESFISFLKSTQGINLIHQINPFPGYIGGSEFIIFLVRGENERADVIIFQGTPE